MPPDPQVHVGVGAVVTRAQGRELLMVKRGGVGRFASDGVGTWSVPGGWLDYGETPWEAAAREVAEETGVEVRPFANAGFVCCFSASAPVEIVTLFIACQLVRGSPRVTEPEKCPQVDFLPIADLAELPLFAPLAEFRLKGLLDRCLCD